MVLDFANEAEEIRKAFEPYYETTLLSEETDPNLLYEIQGRLLGFGVFMEDDVEAFARVYFNPRAGQDRLYAVLEPGAPALRRSRLRRGGRLPRPTERLRTPLCLPLPSADLRRPRPRKALCLRPAPPPPAARRPG